MFFSRDLSSFLFAFFALLRQFFSSFRSPPTRVLTLADILRFSKAEKYEYFLSEMREWRGDEGEGVVSVLSKHGHTKTLASLLSASQWRETGKKEVSRDGLSPIHYAVISGNPDIIGILLDSEIGDVNQKNPNQGWTPLHYASAAGHLSLVEMLVAKGADVNCVDAVGHSPLILSTANNFPEISLFFLSQPSISLTAKSPRHLTAFHYAVLRGQVSVIQRIYDILKDRQIKESPSELELVSRQKTTEGWNVVHLALLGGHTHTFFLVHSWFPSLLHDTKADGESALHLLIKSFSRTFEEALSLSPLSSPGDTSHTSEMNEKREELRSRRDLLVFLIMKCHVDMNVRDVFGKTPLHVAAASGFIWITHMLLTSGASVSLRDFDGLSPLHSVCSSSAATLSLPYDDVTGQPSLSPLSPSDLSPLTVMEAMIRLLVCGKVRENEGPSVYLREFCDEGSEKTIDTIDIDCVDTSNSTALHVAAANSKNGKQAVSILLSLGADVRHVNVQEWTPLHVALHSHSESQSENAMEIVTLLKNHCESSQTLREWVTHTFDPTHPRKCDALAGVRNTFGLTEEQISDIFEGHDPSLAAVSRIILSGKVKNVVVMMGAGVSVSCGIPDYRSKTGLYGEDSPAKHLYSDSRGSSLFNAAIFQESPLSFYSLARDLFLPVVTGHRKPSVSHYFLSLLHKKGILRRIYTQNIDMLELKAGIPSSVVVESHGSMRRSFCLSCHRRFENGITLTVEDEESNQMEKGKEEEEKASKENEKEEVRNLDFWQSISEGNVPLCHVCQGVLRPDVVFFGEPLPAVFVENQFEDLRKCDLLIVMGTSLQVYPFASLANRVSLTTPRLLFNLESVGPFRKISEGTTYRDVQVLGPCDSGVKELLTLLHWDEEIEH